MDLEYRTYIGGKPEDVWNVLVSPETTKQIFFGAAVQSTFEKGDPIMYVGPGPNAKNIVHIHGTILEIEINKVLRHTYVLGESYMVKNPDFQSRVSYELEQIGNCTQLTVIHDRWKQMDPYYDLTKAAWWKLLSIIKTLVETGKPLELSVL